MGLRKTAICLIFLSWMELSQTASITGHVIDKRAQRRRGRIAPDTYFETYGYLDEPDPNRPHDAAARRRAIREFQHMAGLRVTGDINDETVAKMQQPRCGVPDVIKPKDRPRDRGTPGGPEDFKTIGAKWKKKDITYKIVGNTYKLPQSDQRRSYINAFRFWEDVTPLTIREATGSSADILISYGQRNHGDGYPFDGNGGTLAHAFFPGTSAISGDTHFDNDEEWTVRSHEGTNLEIVATHEFGHALGLSHSSVQDSLMAPFYKGYDPNFQLHYDDILGIQTLYGSKPSGGGGGRRDPPRTTRAPSTDYCSLKFDDITTAYDGNTYMFRGKMLYTLERDGNGIQRSQKIRKVFARAPKNVGAVVYQARAQRMYIFKGRKVWSYYRNQLEAGYPKRIRDPFYQKIKAAFEWRDGQIYVFKDDKYAVWHDRFTSVPQGYPRSITSMWRGIPRGIEAATKWTDGITYFFKGRNYFKFDDRHRTKVAGYPKRKESAWLGCGSPTPK